MENMELSIYQGGLPEKPEDLARFVLIGREKLVSVRAQIRAIENLDVAYQVKIQKEEEYRALAEAVLDAEMKLGDLLSKIPKKMGKTKPKQPVEFLIEDTEKTKTEVIEGLGLNKDEAHRFEMLARNKDLVEQCKAEARANNQAPSRSKILNRIRTEEQDKRVITPPKPKSQKKLDEETHQQHIELCAAVFRSYNSALDGIDDLQMDNEYMQALHESINNPISLSYEQKRIKRVLAKINQLQNFLNDLEHEFSK